jgi:transcriptional regulator with XRE-family HTH domain
MDDAVNLSVRTPGERLRELRVGYGLTIKQLAEKIGGGVHFTTISKLERGTMSLSFEWADRIASALPIEPLQLLSDDYARRDFSAVPLYFWYSWTPEGGITSAKQLGWVPTMGGSELSFALGFYPSKDFDNLSEAGLNSVIDPEQRTLVVGNLYGIYFAVDAGPMLATFELDPPRFKLADGGGDVVLGQQYAVVIGRVVFQCRTFGD